MTLTREAGKLGGGSDRCSGHTAMYVKEKGAEAWARMLMKSSS